MKRRLFWKILLGFWITFFAITQGIWLAFTLLRPEMENSARFSVAAASSALQMGGEKGLRAALADWPADRRGMITVRPLASPSVPQSRAPVAQAVVAAPDGARYRIAYYRRPGSTNHGFFAIPVEVIAGGAIGGLVFSAILAWYLTLPIEQLRAGFGRLAQGDFATRLGPLVGRRRDEIADLAHDFDSMAVRLQELVVARDRLLADVSHELRTPLARLTLAVGLSRQDPTRLDASLDRIDAEAAKLDELVGELLTLAQLESGQPRGDDYFSFADVVQRVVQDARYEAAAKKIAVLLAVTPPAEDLEWLVMGNGKLVSRAVENIVRNALRYSPDGGTVALTLQQDAELYRLSVTDEGPGVPPDAMTSLFKPFGLSADGFGFGLGLAIAQRAVAVHGGTISVANRPSQGLEMTLTLPASALENRLENRPENRPENRKA